MSIQRIPETDISDGKSGRTIVKAGDKVTLAPIDHHSNEENEPKEGFITSDTELFLRVFCMDGNEGPYEIEWIGQWPCGGINLYLKPNGFGAKKRNFVVYTED